MFVLETIWAFWGGLLILCVMHYLYEGFITNY